MFTWKRLLLIGAGLCAVAIIFITLILPGMISDRASQWVKEETGRALEIESISINPFNLSVEINTLRLSEKEHEKVFVSWDLLRLSLSIESLYHLAPVVDEFQLVEPKIHLERLTDDRFNFSDLLPDKKKEAESEPEGENAKFSLNNLSIVNGQIEFIDNSLDKPVHHTINEMNLVLPTIGNLPYMVENPAQPLFKAIINDSEINLEGQLKPFSNVQELQFNLNLNGIDLPFYLGYIPIDLPVDVRSGKLSLNLDLLYRISAETGGEFELRGEANIASLSIYDRVEEQLFFLPLLQVVIAPSQPLKKQLHLSALRVYNLEVQLKRDQQGRWNHARMAPEKTGAPPAEENEDTEAFNLLVDTIEIHDGVLFFTDAMVKNGFETVAREINIDVKDFTLDSQRPSPLKFELRTDRNESIIISGQFTLTPLAIDIETKLQSVDTSAYQPYYHDFYSTPLKGLLGLEANIAINPEQTFLLSKGKLDYQDIYVAFNDKEGLAVEEIKISDTTFDLDKNRLEIDSAHYTGGRLNFSRTTEGQWTFISEYFPFLTKLAETSEEPEAVKNSKEGPAFSYRIDDLAVTDWSVEVTDQLPEKTVQLSLKEINLTVNNLAAPDKGESPFTFAAKFQDKGLIDIKGTAALADQSVRLRTFLKRIPLATFAPYIEEQAAIILADGYLTTRLNTAIETKEDTPQVKFDGDIGISRFHLLDSLHSEDLLKWESLQIAEISGGSEPLELNVKSITISDYFAKILVDENAKLNLSEAFSKSEAPEEEIKDSEETIELEEKPAPVITVGTIILQGGTVDFTDRNLPQPFHADMRKLGGRIEGISSDPTARAVVDLRGQLRNQSPLLISGVINPLSEKLFLDLQLDFNDIELSPLSPYSGNYVGYLIEKGKLNLALEYFIEENQLKAKNTVFLDQFTFGKEVKSENATSLPVKLAVALLKDSNGEIHLDIPVFGSLDDPQFSIGGVIWTVVKNLLIKAATSPFALLGAMVGGGEEDFSQVSFEYGSSMLNPAEQEKLLHMTQALADRPSLEIEVSGFIDPEKDEEGYRKEQLRNQLNRLKYMELVEEEELEEGVTQENVIIPAEEREEFLWQVYRKTDFPKPRNFIGMTQKLPSSEMEKLIYANTIVTEDQLSELALARALSVQRFLIEEGQLAADRVFLKKPDIMAAPDQETTYRARAELGVAIH